MGAMTNIANVSVKIDNANLKKKLSKLRDIKNGVPKATTRAINRSLTGMRTDAGRIVAKAYYIKQADVKAKITIKRANWNNLSGAINSKGRPIRLIKFKINPNPYPGVKGTPTVFANVKQSSSGGETGGFITNYKTQSNSGEVNSHSGVFVTQKRKKLFKSGYKYTMKQLYAPGVMQMMSEQDVRKTIKNNAKVRFNKELNHQIKYLLSQN